MFINYNGLLMIKLLKVVMVVVVGYYAAKGAKRRGRNPKTWFLIGCFFGLIGLLILYALPRKKHKFDAYSPPKCAPKEDFLETKVDFKADDLRDIVVWHYINHQKKVCGPVSFEAVSALYRQGEINSDTYVWNRSMEDWARISAVNSFHI